MQTVLKKQYQRPIVDMLLVETQDVLTISIAEGIIGEKDIFSMEVIKDGN